MPFLNMLLRFARSVVEGIIGQFMQQANVIEDSVRAPLNNLLQPIVNGAWTGEGAEAFIDEVTGRLLPDIANLIAAISGVGGDISSAADLLDQGDEQARGIADTLGDIFDAIF